MRVIAGKAKSLRLKTVAGPDTRPTTDRIKETLFNMIAYDVAGSRFLDLFSGSGAIGIEALSRGAGQAFFVENNKQALACIRENLSFTKLLDDAAVIDQDAAFAIKTLSMGRDVMDIIFMDPPYGQNHEREILALLSDCIIVDPDTIIIVEAQLSEDFSYIDELGFEIIKEKRYKTNKHVFIKKR